MLGTIKIIEHSWLEPGPIIVATDIAKVLREHYTDAAKDKASLKALGITTTPETPDDH